MADASGSTIENGIKIIGETIVPGTSLALDGNLKSGALHLAGGLVGKAVLGPLGWVLAAANSYSNSVSGKHLHQHFVKG